MLSNGQAVGGWTSGDPEQGKLKKWVLEKNENDKLDTNLYVMPNLIHFKCCFRCPSESKTSLFAICHIGLSEHKGSV